MQINEKVYNQENDVTSEISSKHVIGFMLCILITSFSLWGAMYTSYTPKLLLYVLAAVAFSQAIIQLFHAQKRSEEKQTV
ncbi:hypothetical protein [Halobacillus sp. B23F22_1]|uniref:hypothetical protein n=1 Tax=Halobacillus sp. B23F22_1 TaxID=3459514 RepID=UPI00373F4D43